MQDIERGHERERERGRDRVREIDVCVCVCVSAHGDFSIRPPTQTHDEGIRRPLQDPPHHTTDLIAP